MQLPFHSYRADTASTARLVNCYAEAAPQGAKGPLILRRSPGITTATSALFGKGRGLHTMGGVLYAVAGTSLYSISNTNAVTTIGAITGSAPVFMADNGTQLGISHDGSLSVLDGTLSAVSDPDVLPNIGAIDFLDSYLIAVERGTGRFGSSALANFSDWDGLDYATAESNPDNLITLKADHRSAVLFGSESIEIWDNAGGTGFPFVRVVNGTIELGVAGEYAVTKQDNSLVWLANDRTLRRLNGITPVRISQHGMERAIRDYDRVDDVIVNNYTINGHLCVVCEFPSANATWVFDATTQEIHELEGLRFSSWDVTGIVECYGRVYVQRASTGAIGILDPKVYTQWEQMLRSEWAYQPIYGQGHRVAVSELKLGIETGVGNAASQDPEITLEISEYGGREGTFEACPVRKIGKQGRFETQVQWNALGSADDFVARCSIADPVPLTVWDTQVEAEVLR